MICERKSVFCREGESFQELLNEALDDLCRRLKELGIPEESRELDERIQIQK